MWATSKHDQTVVKGATLFSWTLGESSPERNAVSSMDVFYKTFMGRQSRTKNAEVLANIVSGHLYL